MPGEDAASEVDYLVAVFGQAGGGVHRALAAAAVNIDGLFLREGLGGKGKEVVGLNVDVQSVVYMAVGIFGGGAHVEQLQGAFRDPLVKRFWGNLCDGRLGGRSGGCCGGLRRSGRVCGGGA